MRDLISRIFLVIFLGLSFGGTSFVAPASAQAITVSAVVVQGNQRIDTSTILSFAAIEVGKAITPGQLNDAYQRLVATGLFESVDLIPRGSRIIIEVREYPTINEVRIEGNKRLKDAALIDLIRSQSRRTFSPAQAEADANALIEAYRVAGRFSADVKPKIIRRSDNRVDLVFEVFEGRVIEVQRLNFVGNRVYSDRRLRRVLETKQSGIFHNLIKSDTYIADRIQFDRQILTDFYRSRGYIDFKVLSVSSELARARNGFFLSFQVSEGLRFRFGEITVSSDLDGINVADFEDIVRLKSGVVYSPALIEGALGRMEELSTRKGLNFIRVEPVVTRNDRDQILDIEFKITRGPRVFVERIDIEGNSTTLDRVIRRQFESVEGDPFNPRLIREAAARINALGFFSKAEVRPREGTGPDQVIVDVDVEDQSTGSLTFGLSYGSSAGFGGEINLTETNFLGRGQYFSLGLTGGADSKRFDLTFAEPSFLDRDLRAEFNAYYRTTTKQNAAYNTLQIGIAPAISFPVSERARLALRYRGSQDEIQNVTTDSSPLIVAGPIITSALGMTYAFDSRRSGFNPNAGIFVELGADFAGLGGEAKYSKAVAKLGAQTSVFNEEVVLKAEFEGGFVVGNGQDTNINDRFSLNASQMRGFQPNGVGPRDLDAVNGDALGGNAYAVARFEASFPIGLPEEYGIHGGLFMDVGSLWGLDNTSGAGAPGSLVDDAMHLRAVAGVSIFWDTAIGPIRFNFSRVLKGEDYDVPENFELTIQTRF